MKKFALMRQIQYLNLYMRKLKELHLLIISMLVCCLAGCGGNQGNMSSSYSSASADANKYFKMADSTAGEAATSYRLQGIEQLIIANQSEDAEEMLFTYKDNDLNHEQIAHKKILQAQIALARRDTRNAQQILRGVWTPHQLPKDLQIKFFTTRAESYLRGGNFMQAIQERIYLSKHLNDPNAQLQNNQQIWDSFSQLTPTTLRSIQKNSKDPELNAWVAFANIMKQYDSSSDQKIRALRVWRQQHPVHAANAFVPTEILMASEPHRKPRKIALLLPLQGKHGESAKAVRDGFLAAYYAQKDNHEKPKIQVYDTTETSSLSKLYQRAVEDGANFVVGPLMKEEVESISAASRNQVPVLALNTTENMRPKENLYQFGLSPEHEAHAVAAKAWADGHRNALVIVPKSSWGSRMQETFITEWRALGGEILAVEEISSQSNINEETKKLLSIDRSEARAAKLLSQGIKSESNPRRRQDADMIFIATNAALARQIKPLLNFYYAGNMPAYASSSVYSGKPQPKLDQDLNGIKFCDMPWVLDNSISARSTYKAVSNLWPNKFEQFARLYALGLDAYKVAMQMDQLTLMPNLGISGMTGMLTLDKSQQVQRKLMWAEFKKGIATIDGE